MQTCQNEKKTINTLKSNTGRDNKGWDPVQQNRLQKDVKQKGAIKSGLEQHVIRSSA